MPTVVGVSFKPVTKVYYFDPGPLLDLQAGEYVLVETSQGREVGQVVWQPRQVSDEEVGAALKPVVRRATPLDLVERDRFQHQEQEALAVCRAKAKEHGLPMKVVSAEYSYDGSRLVVSFVSETRVDFRDLVRDLAKTLGTRVEMKQIGVRDEAKVLNGIGKCGRQLCCSSWLREFNSVSIKMAKQQNLPLNPPEISGVCGRLLCCLAYEMDTYEEARARLPKVGLAVETPDGPGRVKNVHPLRELVTVRLDDGEALRDYPADQVKPLAAAAKAGGCTGCSGCALKSRKNGDAAASPPPQGSAPLPDNGDDQPPRSTGRRRRRRNR